MFFISAKLNANSFLYHSVARIKRSLSTLHMRTPSYPMTMGCDCRGDYIPIQQGSFNNPLWFDTNESNQYFSPDSRVQNSRLIFIFWSNRFRIFVILRADVPTAYNFIGTTCLVTLYAGINVLKFIKILQSHPIFSYKMKCFVISKILYHVNPLSVLRRHLLIEGYLSHYSWSCLTRNFPTSTKLSWIQGL